MAFFGVLDINLKLLPGETTEKVIKKFVANFRNSFRLFEWAELIYWPIRFFFLFKLRNIGEKVQRIPENISWARLKVGRGRAFDHARRLSRDWRGHQVDRQSLATSACTNIPSTLRNRIGQIIKTLKVWKNWLVNLTIFFACRQNLFSKTRGFEWVFWIRGFKRKIIFNLLYH